MSVKSEDELRKLRDEKIKKKFERILAILNEKERALEESVENLEDKLVVRRFEEKIRAKQSVIAQLAFKKDELERKIEEPENKPMSEREEVRQTEETKALPIVVRPPKLDLEAIRKASKEPEKRRFWKFFF